MGITNSTSSLDVGIHIHRRPSVTSVREAKVRMSFCIASNPYGFFGAMYPGRLLSLGQMRNRKRARDILMSRNSIDENLFRTTTVTRPQDPKSLTNTIRGVTNDTIKELLETDRCVGQI